MNVIASGGVATILWSGGANWAWAWLAAAAIIAGARFSHGARITRATILGGTPDQAARWRLQFGIGLYASAASWAVLALVVGESRNADQYMVAIIVSALAAGGTGVMAAMVREGRIYIAGMLGPASVLLFRHDHQGLIMTCLGLVFLLVMLIVHHRNHWVIRHSIELKIENLSLVRDLQTLNYDLERRIEERTAALVNAANSDSLTGLPNRRRLLAWMHAHLNPDDGREAAALFLDLDRFKQINDAMGHEVGDRVLQQVVARMTRLAPAGAMFARWGGDEFVLVLGHGDDACGRAERIANALIDAINRPFEVEGQTISIGLSAGLAIFPTDATTYEALILAADLAVAEVKRQGRGKVLSFCESYAATQKRHFDVSRALTEAIHIEQLVLHYQPIFDARTGHIHGYEALARWNHPTLGAVSPDEFIPIAEESDGIIALGDLVLRRACADAVGWTTSRHAPIVAVNVSVKQLREADFALRVAKILTLTGLPAGRLELEVTESIFAQDHIDATRSSIESLRAIGVSLSIDDFGTGYSSLSRLLSLPVTTVKIDRSFVAAIDGNGGAVIESTLLIARRLGISVIAEGVETREQFERLSAMGVELFQGYYFGKPALLAIDGSEMPWSAGAGSG
ncbi:EAL domain-containing protein [Sphingomonas sp. AR_OL41]|uniref:putative bifunctional diguanylate cyclase/phosphodiesterase n=1 Tax=Sphingomonas sp. AR_OL41 TaxID=3042729 RepID=UPI0024805086|nr:EAL domain-containing protein [Sphingomonas sp. AR_OL41]MDH7972660.1 EAL domain-containing protein [Sphingomonas sp. AR_OL41]